MDRKVYCNGNIYTMDSVEKVDYVITCDGRIEKTGRGAPKVGDDVELFDLKGMTMIPGFIDSHNHMLTAGLAKLQLDLGEFEYDNIAQVMKIVKDYSDKNPKMEWIRCVGLDESKLEEGRIPDRFEVDRYIDDRPVIISRVCGHVSILNTKGIIMSHISNDDIESFGKQFGRQDGEINGIVADDAQDFILRVLPEYTEDEVVCAIDISQNELFQMGICSVHEPGTDQVSSSTYIDSYISANQRNILKMRTYLMGRKEDGRVSHIVEKIKNLKRDYGVEESRLHFGAMKFFADGSIGGKTAAVNEPYCNGDTYGILLSEDIQDLMEYSRKQGFQISVHAIGDRAIESIIDIIESLDDFDKANANRIEHCELCNERILEGLKKNNIMVSFQPAFLHEFGDRYFENLGNERVKRIIPCSTFIDNDLLFSFSADYPFADGRPLTGIRHAVERKTRKGTVINEDEKIDIYEAVKAYTVNGARMSNTDKYQGTIKAGKFADFTIISKDIFCDGIYGARIEYTIINDEVVYKGKCIGNDQLMVP